MPLLSVSRLKKLDVKNLCVCRLEIDNARLEASTKQQSNKIEALQKEVQESVLVSVPERTATALLLTINKASATVPKL